MDINPTEVIGTSYNLYKTYSFHFEPAPEGDTSATLKLNAPYYTEGLSPLVPQGFPDLDGLEVKYDPDALWFRDSGTAGTVGTRIYVDPTCQARTKGSAGETLETRFTLRLVSEHGKSSGTISSGNATAPDSMWPARGTKYVISGSTQPVPLNTAQALKGRHFLLTGGTPDMMILSAKTGRDGKTTVYYARKGGEPVEGETPWVPFP